MGIFTKLFRSDDFPLMEDFSSVVTDMHSHLIPGIDDGSKSLEDSIELIKGLVNLGYKRLITTPHVQADYYKNTPETIKTGLSILRQAIELEHIDVDIMAAAEYYLDYNFQNIVSEGNVLTLGKEKYVLFELSYFNPPNSLNEAIFEMQTQGYKPILAHPERYMFFHFDSKKYEELKDREVYFQLNINSLTGEYSVPVRKVAEKLLSENMIEFIGTDTHNTGHIEALKQALKNKQLSMLMSSGKLLNSTL